jgi:hypothetical protein
MSEWITALSIIAPSVTGVMGYRLAGINEEKRDIRQAQREKDARKAERLQRLRDRNHDFQREVLLGLQDQGRMLTRVTLQAINHDLKTIEDTGQIGRLPDVLDQEVLAAGAAYLEALNRVADDGLRHHLREFHELAAKANSFFGLSPPQAKTQLETVKTKMAFDYRAAHDALGAVLRSELSRED